MNEERQRLAWHLGYVLGAVEDHLMHNKLIHAYNELNAICDQLAKEWKGEKQLWHHAGNDFNDKG